MALDEHAPAPGGERSAARGQGEGSGAGESHSMDHRREHVRIETQRHRIEGFLTLARDGYRSRVSDVLNASEREFLTLTDVTVAPLEGGPVELHPYLTLARRHIVFAVAGSESETG